MQWIKVEDQKPEYHKQVLLKYIKGKREVIIQGYFCDYAQDIADMNLKASKERGKLSDNGIETVEFWRNAGRGETYFDYAERQIQALNAKTSKNKVIAWMEIPQ